MFQPQTKKVPHTPNQNRIQCPVQTSTPYLTRSDTSVSLDSIDKDRSSNSRYLNKYEFIKIARSLKQFYSLNLSVVGDCTFSINLLSVNVSIIYKKIAQFSWNYFSTKQIYQLNLLPTFYTIFVLFITNVRSFILN